MAFQVDMSPLERSSMRIGSSLMDIGNKVGGAIQRSGQQAQQGEAEELMRKALSGDPEAFKELMVKSPQGAMQAAEYIQSQQAGQQGERDQFNAEKLKQNQDTIQKIYRVQSLPEAERAAEYQNIIDNPMDDFDESDLPYMSDPSALNAKAVEFFGADTAKAMFGGQGKESNFAPQVSSIQTDPETGQKYVAITDRNTGEVKRVDAKDAVGETLTQEQDREFRGKSLDDARAISKESFKELLGIKKSIGTIDEAIAAINDKANTGYFDKWLPSFRESTQRLENAAQRMGLDVISATTFGALSEGELRLAMDTAMPSNMQPKELRKWLTERKLAKTKLARELTKMSIQLGKGKTTIAEYLQGNATFGGDISDLSDEDLFK